MNDPLRQPLPDQAELFLRTLDGHPASRPPVWLMRQAGRYLPEYREIRATAPTFLDLCYNPKLAAEVTLQPIRRFGFDAAILFSDILVVPDALGLPVAFESGHGPKLRPVTSEADVASLHEVVDMGRLAPVLETVERVRAALPRDKALIGFCGAPFTVASYMVAGSGTPDQGPARALAYRDPALFGRIIERIVEASITYLAAQLAAGADAVMIFDSWAGVLPTPRIRAVVARPDHAARGRPAPPAPVCEDHRLSARLRWAIVAGRRDRRHGARSRYGRRSALGRIAFCRRASRCKAISTPWR